MDSLPQREFLGNLPIQTKDASISASKAVDMEASLHMIQDERTVRLIPYKDQLLPIP